MSHVDPALSTNNSATAPPLETSPVTHPSAHPQAEFRAVALELITPSKTNPRKLFDGSEFDELVADIALRGVLVPILLRPRPVTLAEVSAMAEVSAKLPHAPVPIGGTVYEVVAGERRFRAATKAGLKEIPAHIREMSDSEALEAQMVENLQRKDLSAMEEARGYRELLDSMAKFDAKARREDLVKQLAARVNKAPRTVYERMKLTELIPEAAKALEEGQIEASHAYLLVRLEAEDQKEAFGMCFDGDYVDMKYVKNGKTASVRNVKARIEARFHTSLKGVPWKLDDFALLPKAGSCTDCTKRSGNSLAGDPAQPDMCLDRACFHAKRERVIQIACEYAAGKGNPKQVARIAKSHSNEDGVLSSWQYKIAEKGSCPTARPAVIVDGKEIGTPVQICTNDKCAVHAKASTSSSSKPAKVDPQAAAKQAEREAVARAKRELECAGDIGVFEAVLRKTTGTEPPVLALLVEALCAGAEYEDSGQDAVAAFFGIPKPKDANQYHWLQDALSKGLAKFSPLQQNRLLVALVIAEGIGAEDYMNFTPAKLDALAKELKLDPKAIRAKAVGEVEAKQKAAAAPKADVRTSAKAAEPAKPVPTSRELASLPMVKKSAVQRPAKKAAKKAAKKGGRK